MKKQLQINKDGFYQKFKDSSSFRFSSNVLKISTYIDNRFVPHWHREIEITLINSGGLYYQAKDTTYTLNPGDIIFVNSSVIHSAWTSEEEDCEYMPFTFSPQIISGEKDSTVDKKYVQELLLNEQFPSFVWRADDADNQRLRELLLNSHRNFRGEEEFYELKVKADLCLIWAIIYRAYSHIKEENGIVSHNKQSVYIQKALDYISENYAEKVSLSDIARHCHLSSSELCRTFKRVMHQSPFEYLIYYRINQSLKLLTDEEKSITDVALMCGFQNSSYYCRVFKKHMGMTPTLYIKKNKKLYQ